MYLIIWSLTEKQQNWISHQLIWFSFINIANLMYMSAEQMLNSISNKKENREIQNKINDRQNRVLFRK